MKKMKVRIGKGGRISIDVEGASGPECIEFTKAVEKAVGTVEKRTLKEDYNKDELAIRVSETEVETAKL